MLGRCDRNSVPTSPPARGQPDRGPCSSTRARRGAVNRPRRDRLGLLALTVAPESTQSMPPRVMATVLGWVPASATSPGFVRRASASSSSVSAKALPAKYDSVVPRKAVGSGAGRARWRRASAGSRRLHSGAGRRVRSAVGRAAAALRVRRWCSGGSRVRRRRPWRRSGRPAPARRRGPQRLPEVFRSVRRCRLALRTRRQAAGRARSGSGPAAGPAQCRRPGRWLRRRQ